MSRIECRLNRGFSWARDYTPRREVISSVNDCKCDEFREMKKDPVSIKNSDRLNVLVVNCRSIRGKQAEFEHLCRSTNAEIIIGTESWLNETIDNREIFPPYFKVFRKDRCE